MGRPPAPRWLRACKNPASKLENTKSVRSGQYLAGTGTGKKSGRIDRNRNTVSDAPVSD